MGTIIKKKINGNNYYYYVETKRNNRKLHYVNPKYLGSADKLLKMVVDSEKPLQDQVLYAHETSFGAVALLYDFAMKLGFAEIIDSIVPKRNQGASIGTYILTAAINRAVAPTSKNGLKEWYESTSLPYITGLALPCLPHIIFGTIPISLQSSWIRSTMPLPQGLLKGAGWIRIC